MDNNRKELRSWGSVLLIWAICDGISLFTSLMDERDVFQSYANSADPLAGKIAMYITVFTIGLSVLSLVLQAFVGFKGMQISKEPSDAVAHIRIAKLLIGLQVILIVGSVPLP